MARIDDPPFDFDWRARAPLFRHSCEATLFQLPAFGIVDTWACGTRATGALEIDFQPDVKALRPQPRRLKRQDGGVERCDGRAADRLDVDVWIDLITRANDPADPEYVVAD